eukprot:625750-Rhodomonas_salina.1
MSGTDSAYDVPRYEQASEASLPPTGVRGFGGAPERSPRGLREFGARSAHCPIGLGEGYAKSGTEIAYWGTRAELAERMARVHARGACYLPTRALCDV